MKPALKPWLSEKNKGTRVQWALERRSWVEEWSFVFFTDESSFEVRRPTRARVWLVEGERYSLNFLRPSFRSGRKSGSSSALTISWNSVLTFSHTLCTFHPIVFHVSICRLRGTI